MIFLLPYLGGLLSIWHGGNLPPHAPKALKNLLWSLPFILAIACINSWYTPLGLLCLLKGMGHGDVYQPKKPLDPSVKPEKLEYPILWLRGKISDTAYKTLAMSLIGLAAVSGSVLGVVGVSPVAASFLALGGLAKGLNAYLFSDLTAVREFADGTTAYLGLAAAIWYLGV